MKTVRLIAAGFLLAVFLATLLAEFVAPAPYAKQFREAPNAQPSWRHPLGTDELGRDALSRLLYGTRVSLLLAPIAALLATLIAALVGGTAGYLGHGYFVTVKHAVVALKDGAEAAAEDLRAFLARKYAKWQLPDAFVFIPEIPHTSTGKLLKAKLRERFKEWKWGKMNES